MTEMNLLTMERTAEKVLAAIKNEGLMYKEAAEILGFSQTYLSSIKRSDSFHHVPRKAWEVMHAWAQTGKLLKGYKGPAAPEPDEQTGQAPEPAVTALPVPKVKYILTKDPEPKKRGPKINPDKIAAAEKKRKEFEASRGVTVEHKDPAELNPKTGTPLAVIEFYERRLNIIFPK